MDLVYPYVGHQNVSVQLRLATLQSLSTQSKLISLLHIGNHLTQQATFVGK